MSAAAERGGAIRTRLRENLVDGVAVCVVIACTSVLLVLINSH
ncbi:hypothetical protein [Streptomyces sp. NP-1717]|nr:hypothetical protein [Streptomyces sp. NP-1717]WTA75065.1 hypothetical protein OG705_20445 [Streptomyces sp. NBC_00838]